MKSWLLAAPGKDPQSSISEITINEESYQNVSTPEPYKDPKTGYICQEFNVTLQGSTRYSVKYQREQEYNINDDYYIGFRSLYILNGMKVCLDLPENINATFLERGTQNQFETIKKNQKIE